MGKLYLTRGVAGLAAESAGFSKHVSDSVERYARCDWGDLCKSDKRLNDRALKDGDRLMGDYKHPEHPSWRIFIITEWDRSATTVLFPDEY